MNASRSAAAATVAVVCAGLAACIGHAQEPQEFRAGIDLVPLHVSVTDRDGQLIRDLTREDFEILDEGRVVRVGTFAAPPRPVALKLLLDNRRPMARHVPRVREVGAALIAAVGADDRLSLTNFQYRQSSFTSDKARLLGALEVLLQGPRPPVYDSYFAWTPFETSRAFFNVRRAVDASPLESPWQRPGEERWEGGVVPELRVLVVASSGMDAIEPGVLAWQQEITAAGGALAYDFGVAPRHLDEMVRKTVRQNFIVFGLGFEGRRNEQRLPGLAGDTGGWFVEVKRGTDLAAEVQRIMNDLRARYLIGLVPTVFDGKDHLLTVRVKRPGATVRARAYYQAPLRNPCC